MTVPQREFRQEIAAIFARRLWVDKYQLAKALEITVEVLTFHVLDGTVRMPQKPCPWASWKGADAAAIVLDWEDAERVGCAND